MNWEAETKSGAVYTMEHGILRITFSRTGNATFSVWEMKSNASPVGMPWVDESWREVEAPVVGERFYAKGKDEWRISSTIVSVKELALSD